MSELSDIRICNKVEKKRQKKKIICVPIAIMFLARESTHDGLPRGVFHEQKV